MLKKNLN